MPELCPDEVEKLQECLSDYISMLESDPNFDIDDEIFEKYEKAKESLNLLDEFTE